MPRKGTGHTSWPIPQRPGRAHLRPLLQPALRGRDYPAARQSSSCGRGVKRERRRAARSAFLLLLPRSMARRDAGTAPGLCLLLLLFLGSQRLGPAAAQPPPPQRGSVWCPSRCLCFRTTVRCMHLMLESVPAVSPQTTIL